MGMQNPAKLVKAEDSGSHDGQMRSWVRKRRAQLVGKSGPYVEAIHTRLDAIAKTIKPRPAGRTHAQAVADGFAYDRPKGSRHDYW